MGVRITIMVMRVVVLTTLVLGVIFWVNPSAETDTTLPLHRTLGILTIVLLWILASLALRVKGGLMLAIAAFALGLIVVFVGFNQMTWLIGSAHWVIRVIHLLFGLAALGLGERIAAHYRRVTKDGQPATQQAG